MPDDFLPLTLHASEYPERRRAELLAALRERRLPAQALYLSLAQAQRWLDYHAAWSPSRTDPALQARYGEAYDAAAALLPAGGTAPFAADGAVPFAAHGAVPFAADGAVPFAADGAVPFAADGAVLIGLGCGGGSKDADLAVRLTARLTVRPTAAAAAAPLHYVPVDASTALVAEAARLVRERCQEAGDQTPSGMVIGLHPLIADLSAAPALGDWLAARAGPETPRVYSCFGMLPNMDPSAFPRWLARLLRPQDVLLVSANLSPGGLNADGPRILRQYDNPQARAWYLGALAELGLSGSTYSLGVEARPLAPGDLPAPAGAAWRIAVTAVLRKEVSLAVHGEVLELAAGERLAVFQSLRFTAEAGAALLAAAGLAVERRWEGAQGEEGIFLCRRA